MNVENSGGRMPIEKYRAFQPIELTDRQWPGRSITKAPIWCSVDLRDGNQALVEPMDPERKRRLFDVLVGMGFKEIEVGFPSASETDYAFLRQLIDEDLIPDDVTIQVLTQSRDHLIERTFESLQGVKKAIVHLYNSTSTLQRRVVFGKDRAGIVDIAVTGAYQIFEQAKQLTGTDVQFQYSPESFTGTELDFAKEICEAVMDVWQPTPDRKVILNLPATVEMSVPNIFADQIEWFDRNVKDRDCVTLSLHPHNDRGTGVAAAEMGVLAGADRIEGTLFGNGERTGNVDVVTLALNLFTQGVDPCLDVSNIDAIRESNSGVWEVPYLPIDPQDVGRSYEAIVRINSQSGKGGVAFLLQRDHGLELPRGLQVDFAQRVQQVTDETGKELSSAEIWQLFQDSYLTANSPFEFVNHRSRPDSHASERRVLTAIIRENGEEREIQGRGNGPIDAFVAGLGKICDTSLRVLDYHEHAIGAGADAAAVAYVEAETPAGRKLWGVGMHPNIVTASLRAVVSAANQAQ